MEAYVLIGKIVLGVVIFFVAAGMLGLVVGCWIEHTAPRGYEIPGRGFVSQEDADKAMEENGKNG